MAFNFALIADDALDGYLQYQAANKQLEANRRKKQGTPKVANMLEDNILHVMQNPNVLVPSARTLGLSAAGVIASAYAPSWAGGPGEGEEVMSPKRALKAIVAYNVLGKSVASVPGAIEKLMASSSPLERISHASQILPPVALAGSVAIPLMKGEKPDGSNIVRNYRVASYASGAGALLHPDVTAAALAFHNKMMEDM